MFYLTIPLPILPQVAGKMQNPSSFHEAQLPHFAQKDELETLMGILSDRVPSSLVGYRRRLRTRFIDSGAAALPDGELLELMLFRALSRHDVKPLARKLLETFGDFNRVLAAEPTQLLRVKGVSEALIIHLKVIEAAAHRMMRAKVMHRPVQSTWEALLDYCHTVMSHRQIECLRVLFLNRKNVLIADEEQASGTVDHVPVYPREIMKRALELNASALILVHNHPSGDPKPSVSDIAMTSRVLHVASGLGITLYDHLIIGKSRKVSLRELGYI